MGLVWDFAGECSLQTKKEAKPYHFNYPLKKALRFTLLAFCNEINLISLALGFSPEKRKKTLFHWHWAKASNF